MDDRVEVEMVSPARLSPEASQSRRERYSRAWSGVEVRMRTVASSETLPDRLESPEDIDEVSRAFAAMLGDQGGEVRIADCMLDPGVEHVDSPVSFGLFERLARSLERDGRRVVLISRNEAMRDRMEFLVDRYELRRTCPRAYSIDVPAGRAFSAAAWEAGVLALRESGERLPVLACCTGVHFDPENARRLDILTPYDILPGVIDSL